MTDILEGLAKSEKQALLDRLTYELQPKSDGPSVAEGDLWEAVHAALEIAPQRRQPLSRFLERYGRKRFAENAEYLAAFIAEGTSGTVTRVVRAQLGRVVMDCLRKHLAVRGIPTTPQVLLQSLETLPYAVERRFPGYCGARLLHRVVMLSAAYDAAEPKPETPQKAAPEPGRARGGYARSAKLEPARRVEIARDAAAARWGRKAG